MYSQARKIESIMFYICEAGTKGVFSSQKKSGGDIAMFCLGAAGIFARVL